MGPERNAKLFIKLLKTAKEDSDFHVPALIFRTEILKDVEKGISLFSGKKRKFGSNLHLLYFLLKILWW